MKIKQINHTNFNGIYKLQKTTANIKELEEQVMPIYNWIRKEKISFFVGSNPFKLDLLAALKHTAQINGADIEWLKENAKRHDLDLSSIGDDTIHIITGNEDNRRINKFIGKRLSKKTGFFKKLSQKAEIKKLKRNLPEHLQTIIEDIFYDEEENKYFNKFANNIINVKTPYELLEKAFAEKR